MYYIEYMKEGFSKTSLLILSILGLAVFGVNAFFLFSSSLEQKSAVLYIIFLILQIAYGIILAVLAVKKTKKASPLFIGLSLIYIAIMDFFVSFIFSYTITQWWPVYGLVLSFFLLASGLFKYKKLKFGFAIPSFTIFAMCLWYTLFSFKIIKIPFMTVVWYLGIGFLCAVAAVLILFFFLQQKHKELVISDEDTGVFEDETSSVLKLDD